MHCVQSRKSKDQTEMATTINDRIDIRISKEQKELVKLASELRGFKSLSEFIVFCVNAEAKRIIQENDNVLKTIDDKRIFLDALLNPPVPNDKLKEAQLKYLKFKKANGVSD